MDQNQQPQVQPIQTAPVPQPALPQVSTPVAQVVKKKLPKWAKILIIIASICLLIGIVTIIIASIVLKDNDKEVQGFLNAIYSSNYDVAYDYYTTEVKETISQDTFEYQVQTLKAAGIDSSCRTNWTTNSIKSSTTTGSTKEIDGTINCNKGSFSARFILIKQDDNYKLLESFISPK